MQQDGGIPVKGFALLAILIPFFDQVSTAGAMLKVKLS
jgi:hypothetical protein